jgi:hypothetical protein
VTKTIKLKNKPEKIINQELEQPEELPFVPPETHYISERYEIEVPLNDEHFESPWKLRVYAVKLVEHRLGDSVQVTKVKVRKPHLIAKSKARLLKRQPTARLYLTIKF